MINICGKDVRIDGRFIRIAHLDGDKYNSPSDPEAMLAGLRRVDERIDLFTFLQPLPDTAPKYSYAMEWDNLAVLKVSTYDHWWSNQIPSTVRNRARQAGKRGVTFRVVPFGEELLKGICEIYNETPVRLGKPFPHYGMTMERARDYAGTFLDRSVYIGAFFGDSMVGFTKLVLNDTGTYGCLVHILSMVRHKEKAVTNALIAEAVRLCAERQIGYLVYENFSYGKKQTDSLSHFKEVNGFRRVDLPRYFIPLTVVGKTAFRLGLHHKLVDHLPAPVAAKLRDFRKAWYGRKLQQTSEA